MDYKLLGKQNAEWGLGIRTQEEGSWERVKRFREREGKIAKRYKPVKSNDSHRSRCFEDERPLRLREVEGSRPTGGHPPSKKMGTNRSPDLALGHKRGLRLGEVSLTPQRSCLEQRRSTCAHSECHVDECNTGC